MKRLLLVLILLLISACTAKENARWGDENSRQLVGAVPDDACMVNGNPIILSVSMDEGDLHLVYVNRDGEIVMAQWMKDPILGTGTRRAGSMYWTGGYCPS